MIVYAPELPLFAPLPIADVPLVPVRMVNEYVYCPRLAYLMWGQAEWAETSDTWKGAVFTDVLIVLMRRYLHLARWTLTRRG